MLERPAALRDGGWGEKAMWRIKTKLVAFLAAVSILSACNDSPTQGADRANWRLLGGGSDQWYYSQSQQIDQANVSRLGLAWYVDVEARDGLVGNPLVADGAIYQGGPPGQIFVNDLRTGRSLWTYTPEFEYLEGTSWTGFWGTHVNRGIALDDDNVYIGSYCRLLAVSRTTHELAWEAQSCDPRRMQAITGAPRVGGGRGYIGNASGDNGSDRGFLDAFDARTGRHLWRFYTMPGDPSQPFETPELEMASRTWGTDYRKYTQGGVSPWDAITYDEATDTLYFGTDGPSPWSPSQRAPDAGDELFTDSIIAVDAETGAYKWHFQTVQHDGWNMSATMHIMLSDLPVEGSGTRRVVMTAPKNGFFYVLDAESGEFISGNNYVPVNWTTGLDPRTGRPNRSTEANYWERPGEDVIPLPGDVGAHNWQAMAFSPENGLVYIPASTVPVLMTVNPDSPAGADADYYYGLRPDARVRMSGELVAWDPRTQSARWRARRTLPINGGILATAGNLVFQGTGDGKFEAYAADTGEKLWSYDVGGSILAAPSTVMVDGVQYIIVASGNGESSGMRGIPRLMNNLQSQGPARLLAFRLDGDAALPIEPPPVFPRPALPRPSSAAAERGRQVFANNICSGCHGYNAIGSGPAGIPDLRMMSPETTAIFRDIVVDGLYRPNGMPSFPAMTQRELDDLRAYLTYQAWEGYEEDQARRRDNGNGNATR